MLNNNNHVDVSSIISSIDMIISTIVGTITDKFICSTSATLICKTTQMTICGFVIAEFIWVAIRPETRYKNTMNKFVKTVRTSTQINVFTSSVLLTHRKIST